MNRAALLLSCLLAPFLLACSSPPTPARRVKLFVDTDGFYRVTAQSLAAAGANLAGVDPETLRLFTEDKQVAIRVAGSGESLTFDFYGQGSDSAYSKSRVYYLDWGGKVGERIGTILSPTHNSPPATAFRDLAQIDHPMLFVPQAGEPGNRWFWTALSAPSNIEIVVPLPAASKDQAEIRIDLWGNTLDVVNPDHHLVVEFNGVPIANVKWDGQGRKHLQAAVPADVMKDGENELRLVVPGDTGAAAEIVLVEAVQVEYSRRFVAQGNSLSFLSDRGVYQIHGLNGEPVEAFDITDPLSPARVGDVRIRADGAVFSTRAGEMRRWLVLGPSAFKTVSRVAPMHDAEMVAEVADADYLIIAHPSLASSAEPLAQWRARQGLETAIVTTEQVYDAFGHGTESPIALRAFLSSLRPGPRFVLLLGKASYDYRDYTRGPNRNLVPTYLLDTPHLNQAGSDNWFVAKSETDIRPAAAIGRIPAKTPEQADAVTKKIIEYESGFANAAWRKRATFISDDKEESFPLMAESLAARLAPSVSGLQLPLASFDNDLKAARAKVIQQWNAGSLMLTYVGHGSLETWAEGPLLGVGNLGEIKNGNRLPLLVTPTCLDGYFYHPSKDSLAESLLFKSDGGVIAGIVPTGLSVPSAQSEIMSALFDELMRNRTPTVGEGLMRAKQKEELETPEVKEVIETFVLLGDPALRWTLPE